jgi:hypothetical protein
MTGTARIPRRLAIAAGLVAGLLLPAEALAQRVLGAGPQRPLKLEGFWDRTRSVREVIGEIVISADGETRRTFGVTGVQAFQPEEEGMQIFRHSSLQPITLLLRGRSRLVRRFLEARPEEKVVALGVYRAGSATFILGSVEVVPPPEPARD